MTFIEQAVNEFEEKFPNNTYDIPYYEAQSFLISALTKQAELYRGAVVKLSKVDGEDVALKVSKNYVEGIKWCSKETLNRMEKI